jgi:hypothetical protein
MHISNVVMILHIILLLIRCISLQALKERRDGGMRHHPGREACAGPIILLKDVRFHVIDVDTIMWNNQIVVSVAVVYRKGLHVFKQERRRHLRSPDVLFGVVEAPLGTDVLSSVAACSPLAPTTPVSKNIMEWEAELKEDLNKEFILNGIRFGFRIIDRPCTLKNVCLRNYRSCLFESRELVEAQITKEIRLGCYVVVEEPPSII